MAEFDPDAYLARDEKRKEKTKGFDPDAYLKKTEPESALQTFGRSTASMADSALNALTGTLDYGAYALARAAGRSPEQATAETTSPKDVVGRAFGVAGTPGYENAPLRRAGTAIGQGLQENVITPIAGATGLPETDVANMVNTGMMAAGPAVPRVAGAVKPVIQAPVDVARGFAGTVTGRTAAPGAQPKPYQQPSVRQPVGDTYIPADVLAQYRAGQISAEAAQAAARPTSELKGLAATGGNVPYAGQGMRAFGEQLGETYRNPLNVLTDVGLDVVTGGPIPTLGRLGYKGYQAYNANKLSDLGFTPLAPDEFTALRPGGGGPGPGGGTGSVRQQAAARINTQGLPPDVVAAQEAAAQAKVAAAEAAAQERLAAERAVQPVDPAYIAQQQAAAAAEAEAAAQAKAAARARAEQMAADIMAKRQAETQATLGEVSGPVAPTKDIVPMESPESRAIARAEAKAETPLTTREKLDKTVQTAYRPVAGRGNVLDKTLIDETLAGEGLPAVDWNKLGTDYQSMSVRDARKTIQKFVEKETGVSGAGSRGPTAKTQMKEANERLAYEQAQRSPEEIAKELADMQAAIERRKRVLGDRYRAPGGDRFSMMTGEPEAPTPQVFANEADFKQQRSFDILSGQPTIGTWIEGTKTIHSEEIAPFMTKTHIYATDTATGKRVPRGETWTAEDPKPSGVETAEKIRANFNKKVEPEGSYGNPYLDKEDAKQHVFSSRLEGNKYHRVNWKEDGNLREYTENPQEAEVSTKRPDGSSQRIVRETVYNPKTGDKSYQYKRYEFDADWNSTGDIDISTTKPDWWPW